MNTCLLSNVVVVVIIIITVLLKSIRLPINHQER